MRTVSISIIATLLLCLPLVLAQPQYWIVIDDEGTPVDVVNAANFAASMKGSVAVTFESRTESQAEENLRTIDPDNLLMVSFRDDTITVNPGDFAGFSSVVQNIEVYGEREGFEVEVQGTAQATVPDREEEPEQEFEPTTQEIVCTSDVFECWDGSFVSRDPENDCTFDPCPSRPETQEESKPSQPSEQQSDSESSDDSSEETPGVFVRVWTWFFGIFS